MITCGKMAPFCQTFIAETADGPADIIGSLKRVAPKVMNIHL
jgi:hypothetical protein